ncbi:MAG: ATP-binding protein [Clostridia bacterium]|nr:ATP-binding protein [Clostridia bacterium]
MHSAFEVLCAFITLSTFIIVWFTIDINKSSTKVIGFGFLAVFIFDVLHIYFFPPLNNNKGYYNLCVIYFLFARMTEASVLLLSTAYNLRASRNKWALLCGTLCAAIFISVILFFYGTERILHTDSITTIFEIIIIIMYLAVLIRLYKRINKRSVVSYKKIYLAVLIALTAQICFSLFDSIYSFTAVFGHCLRIVYAYFIFKGIFASSVQFPFKSIERAKNKLKEAESELRDILNGLPLAIITYDSSLRVKYTNSRVLELLECRREDICGLHADNIYERFGAIPENPYENIVYKAISNPNASINKVRRCKTAKGNEINLNISALKYKNGVLSIFTDANKEQDLVDLKIQTRTILDSAYSAIMIFDNDFKLVMVNKALKDFVEMEYKDIIGKDIRNLIEALKFTVKGMPFDVDAQNYNLDNSFEGTIINSSGALVEVLINTSPIKNFDGRIIGYICVWSDITRLKIEHQRLQQQEKLAIIGQMGSGIVHETKNHLASIKGYCQLLASKLSDTQSKKYVKRIEDISEDLNRVIVDFLSLAKPSETEMDIHSINEIVESMRYMLESPSFMRSVKITINLCKFDKDIKADESQIKQVILNMSKNAIEAMAERKDGHLMISTYLSQDEKEMLLTFADNGSGISKENLSKLGAPFFTTKETGTGLGLNVCFRIIKEHGGNVKIISEEGKGTTFIISFPCYEG